MSPALPDPRSAAASPLSPGDSIGPYRLARRIGKGGMAEVWEASREDGLIVRPVAIKVMACSWSAEDPSVEQRFRAERQILAALMHPNIARLLDGGVTAGGHQYVVMDFVRGATLDVYLRRENPSRAQRLALFLELCGAVQYAHRRLIVHRDIKPGNIMISDEGGLKLVDFGIAKLLRPEFWRGVEAAETIPANRLATPEFAAPEQLAGEPVTTASDVYSLGVILYYLLTGRLPYDCEGKSWQEISHTIQANAPRPMGAAVEPDLEAIALMALRKEPEGRYSSVEHLADDVRRHLAHQPVRARRGLWWYPAARFVRRNAIAAGLAATLVVTLAGAVALQWRANRALRAEYETAWYALDFMADLFEIADPNARGPRTARDVLDAAAARVREMNDRPRVQAHLAEKLGDVYRQQALYAESEPLTRLALQRYREVDGRDSPHAARNMVRLADLLRESQRYDEAESLAVESVAARRKHFGAKHFEVADALNILGILCQIRGDLGRAETVFREAVEIRRVSRMPREKESEQMLALSLGNLGNILREKADLAGAEALFREALELRRFVFGPRHSRVGSSLGQLSQIALARGNAPEAARLAAECVAIMREAMPAGHPDLARSLLHYGNALRESSRLPESEAALAEGLAIAVKARGAEAPESTMVAVALAHTLIRAGHFAGAEPHLRASLAARRKKLGPNHPLVAAVLRDLAQLRLRLDDRREARALFEEALAIRTRAKGQADKEAQALRVQLAAL